MPDDKRNFSFFKSANLLGYTLIEILVAITIMTLLFLTGFANYTHFQYGKSQVVSGFFEPDSRTNEIKVGVGIRYTWSH